MSKLTGMEPMLSTGDDSEINGLEPALGGDRRIVLPWHQQAPFKIQAHDIAFRELQQVVIDRLIQEACIPLQFWLYQPRPIRYYDETIPLPPLE